MKVTSIRSGFATNSSSSHSVISGGNSWSGSTEEIAEKYNGNIGEREFGWGYETHDDMHSIINYALILFIPMNEKESFQDMFGDRDYSNELMTILEKFYDGKSDYTYFSYGYIDHQSGYEEHGNPRSDDKIAEEDFWNFITNTTELIIDNDNH